MKKRIVSIAISVFMAMSIFAVPTFAEDYNAYNEGDFFWSEWSTAVPAAGTEYESKTQYSYRNKSYTQSGYNSLNGYVKYDTKITEATSGYYFGTPITTSTNYTSTSKVVKSAVNSGYYYYAYAVANPNKTSDWTYFLSKTRASVISHMKKNFSASSAWGESRLRYFWYISTKDLGSMTGNMNKSIPYCSDSTVSVGTTSKTGTHYMDLKLYKYSRCYKVKTTTTTNYFYKWGDWSSYSDSYVSSSGDREVQTRKVYRYKIYSQGISCDNTFDKVYDTEGFYLGAAASTPLTYSSSDTSIATVSDDGYVTMNKAGTVKITITAQATPTYQGDTKIITVNIKKASPGLTYEGKTSISKVYDADGFSVEAESLAGVVYSSSNENVVSVSDDGWATMNGAGTAVITIKTPSSNKYKIESKKVTVTVKKATQSISCAVASSVKKNFGAGAFSLGAKANTKLTYSSSNKKVATVSSKGVVTLKNPGSATITINAAGTGKYKSATKKIKINVVLKAPVLTAKAYKSNGVRKVKLSWTKPYGTSGYQLVEYRPAAKKTRVIPVSKSTYTNATVKNLKKKTTYKYKIRAYRIVNGKKVYSAYTPYKAIYFSK